MSLMRVAFLPINVILFIPFLLYWWIMSIARVHTLKVCVMKLSWNKRNWRLILSWAEILLQHFLSSIFISLPSLFMVDYPISLTWIVCLSTVFLLQSLKLQFWIGLLYICINLETKYSFFYLSFSLAVHVCPTILHSCFTFHILSKA